MESEEPPLVAVPKTEDRIKALVDMANKISVDDAIPIKRYWRSGRELLRMAKVYLDEYNLEKCFVLYMKYIILFIEKLPKHCEYKTADVNEKNNVVNNCTKLMELAEDIKSRLKKRFKKEHDEYLEKKKIFDAKQREKELARKRLLEERKMSNDKKVPNDEFVSDLQRQLDLKRKELEERNKRSSVIPSVPVVPSAPKVPVADKPTVDEDSEEDLSDEISSLSVSDKVVKPAIDRSTKPTNLVVDLGKTDQLSALIVPFKSITEKFTKVAQSNTSRNIETCAILAGRLSRNQFTITHLMFPKQTGTSDSCTAINEEELAFEQERLSLITVGWIHTHPSQKSFLSSIDLHTHAPYQKMLPEAIAIVVAPSYNEISIYSLTEHGLEYILKCRKTGFHPHANENTIYGEAKHVRIDDSLTVDVADFR